MPTYHIWVIVGVSILINCDVHAYDGYGLLVFITCVYDLRVHNYIMYVRIHK